jgi:hypothetical protein
MQISVAMCLYQPDTLDVSSLSSPARGRGTAATRLLEVHRDDSAPAATLGVDGGQGSSELLVIPTFVEMTDKG